jgi:mannosyltransferase OCH1-like enzyme
MNIIFFIIIIILILLSLSLYYYQKDTFINDTNVKNNTPLKIPKVIYLTYKTKNIPTSVIKKWETIYPDYEIKIYDNNDCIDFLNKEFGQEYVDIFNFIKDGPIKADFWRVCILYKYGGIYSDVDVVPNINVEEILLPDVKFLTCICAFFKNITPHFMVSMPNEEVLKLCIDKYIEFYRIKHTYSYWGWSIMHIMKPILCNILNRCVNKDGAYYDSDGNLYQFLKEKHNFKLSDLFSLKFIDKIMNLGRGMHCEYNNKIILYNKNDEYSNHEFI